MARMKLLLASVAGMALSASIAHAAAFVGDYNVTANTADPGLVVQITPIAPLVDGLNFSLTNSGDFTYIDLFEIVTPEGSINVPEDTNAKFIEVSFSFVSPAMFGGAVTGTTRAFIDLFGNEQGGRVAWDNDGIVDMAFGNGGLLRLDLDDGSFSNNCLLKGFFQGCGGLNPNGPDPAIVTAKATLISAAVPEPGTWALMILGFGAAGAMIRRNRLVVA